MKSVLKKLNSNYVNFFSTFQPWAGYLVQCKILRDAYFLCFTVGLCLSFYDKDALGR